MFFLSKFIIVSLPFSNLFALGTFATISFLSSQLFLFLFILHNKKIVKNYLVNLFFILLLFGFVSILIYLFHYDNIHDYFGKAYRTFVFILLYIISISIIFKKYGINHVLKYLYYATWIVIIYGLFDFVLSNFIGLNLDDYLYRYNAEINHGSVGSIVRLRSTLSESGHLAFYMNTIFPLTLLYLNFIRKKLNYLYLLLGTTVFVLTFSAAGFVIFLISIIFSTLLLKRYKRLLVLTMLFTGIVIGSNTFYSNSILVKKITKKLTLNERSISVHDRLNRYIIAKEEFDKNFNSIEIYLFGVSPGYIVEKYNSGLVNFFLNMFIEHGIVGLLIIIILLYKVFRTIKEIKLEYRIYCYYILISIILHLIIIQNFYYLFVYLSLLGIYYLKIKDQHEKNSIFN